MHPGSRPFVFEAAQASLRSSFILSPRRPADGCVKELLPLRVPTGGSVIFEEEADAPCRSCQADHRRAAFVAVQHNAAGIAYERADLGRMAGQRLCKRGVRPQQANSIELSIARSSKFICSQPKANEFATTCRAVPRGFP